MTRIAPALCRLARHGHACRPGRERGPAPTVRLDGPRARGLTGGSASARRRGRPAATGPIGYPSCLLTSFVISNMLTTALPPNTGLRAASARMLRGFFGSCSWFFLM